MTDLDRLVEAVARATLLADLLAHSWEESAAREHVEEHWKVCIPHARAAILATLKGIREPSEAMWSAGRDPIMARDAVKSTWTLGEHLREAFAETPAWAASESPDLGHISKGACAVMVYRAMIDRLLSDLESANAPEGGDA